MLSIQINHLYILDISRANAWENSYEYFHYRILMYRQAVGLMEKARSTEYYFSGTLLFGAPI